MALDTPVSWRKLSKHTGELGRCGTHQCYETGGVDNTTADMKSLGFVGRIVPHCLDSIFAAPPHALEVNLHCQIPNCFFSIEGMII